MIPWRDAIILDFFQNWKSLIVRKRQVRFGNFLYVIFWLHMGFLDEIS